MVGSGGVGLAVDRGCAHRILRPEGRLRLCAGLGHVHRTSRQGRWIERDIPRREGGAESVAVGRRVAPPRTGSARGRPLRARRATVPARRAAVLGQGLADQRLLLERSHHRRCVLRRDRLRERRGDRYVVVAAIHSETRALRSCGGVRNSRSTHWRVDDTQTATSTRERASDPAVGAIAFGFQSRLVIMVRVVLDSWGGGDRRVGRTVVFPFLRRGTNRSRS